MLISFLIIADVQNRARMFEIMETYKPYAVYHAAAHKHVPLMEDNPEEAVRNNILVRKILLKLLKMQR